MKMRAVVEVQTETYVEQQYILAKFPFAVWITLDENKTRFYLPYPHYVEIKNAISEWENEHGKRKL